MRLFLNDLHGKNFIVISSSYASEVYAVYVIIIDPSSLIKQKDKLTSDEKHAFLHELVKTIIGNTIVNGNKSFTSTVVVKMAFVDYKSGNDSMECVVSTTGL